MVFSNVYGYKLCVPTSASIWLLHYITDTGSRAGRYQSFLNELLLLLPVCGHFYLCNPPSYAKPRYFGSLPLQDSKDLLCIYIEKMDKLEPAGGDWRQKFFSEARRLW